MSSASVAIIGAGNLGRRHLQGVLKLDRRLQVFVFDPVMASLDLARSAAEQVMLGNSQTSVIYIDTMSALPDRVDAAIVATSADVRLGAIKDLLEVTNPRNLLLEKLLFQSLSEFDEAEQVLKGLGGRIWVNTARRVMLPHHKIKDFFAGHTIAQFTVTGGLWGLGTSFIHLLDLLDFYQPGAVTKVNTAALSHSIPESKRAGYKELTGTLIGRLGGAQFSLSSTPENTGPLRIVVEAPDRLCIIEEAAGRAVFCMAQDVQTIRFTLDYISDTTTRVLAAMLEEQDVGLPDYETSALLHRTMIASLGPYFADRLGTPSDFIPLT